MSYFDTSYSDPSTIRAAELDYKKQELVMNQYYKNKKWDMKALRYHKDNLLDTDNLTFVRSCSVAGENIAIFFNVKNNYYELVRLNDRSKPVYRGIYNAASCIANLCPHKVPKGKKWDYEEVCLTLDNSDEGPKCILEFFGRELYKYDKEMIVGGKEKHIIEMGKAVPSHQRRIKKAEVIAYCQGVYIVAAITVDVPRIGMDETKCLWLYSVSRNEEGEWDSSSTKFLLRVHNVDSILDYTFVNGELYVIYKELLGNGAEKTGVIEVSTPKDIPVVVH